METNLRGLFRVVLFSVRIFLFCFIFATVFNALNPNGVALFSQHNAEGVEEKEPFIRVDSNHVQALYNKVGVIFVDARSKKDYLKNHIKGAISIPKEDFTAQFEKLHGLIAIDAEIVVYCGSEYCPSSEKVARRLMKEGYSKIYVYGNGWNEWLMLKLPTEVIN
ncbi:MAG: hypothetical protein A2044_02495 [Candidatus Firestonebacteria bacterium GWA2_43_8]|nr:MAG: hypothetical protein A2044_02495 [Candidatus Firestonebacteria bacterium GWA2_43_8]